MQARSLVEVCREFNKLFSENHKLEEGDHVLVETISGIKDTFVKKTNSGRLIAEIVELNKKDELITIDIKELGDKYYIIPSWDTMVKLAFEKGLEAGNNALKGK